MTLRPQALRPRPATPRRTPVDWRRYSAQARTARQRLRRTGHPLAVRLAVSLVFTVAGLALLQLVGVGVAGGIADLGHSVVKALPQQTAGDLVLGETQVSVAGAPVLDPLPEFTKSTAVTLAGKVPSFALAPGRRVSVTVNGTTVGTAQLAPDGRFGPTPLTLIDGPNIVKVTLVDGATEVASTSANITVDRVAPKLTITSPKSGDTVAGPDVVVSGATEAGANVILNDRVLRPNPDGTFTDRIVAPPAGPLSITIVATDKAGNETKTQLQVTVKPNASPTAAVGVGLRLVLDRTTVPPGGTVIATISATEDAKPKADVAVTLQVGVITIGTYRTDSTGTARVSFAAPDHEVQAATVLALGGGTSATASLTVVKPTQ